MINLERQNFISVDGNTIKNSYGESFTIGELVGHDDERAGTTKILSFEPIIEDNEIKVVTEKGYCRADFLVKINPHHNED